jgi:hypothetical protein
MIRIGLRKPLRKLSQHALACRSPRINAPPLRPAAAAANFDWLDAAAASRRRHRRPTFYSNFDWLDYGLFQF